MKLYCGPKHVIAIELKKKFVLSTDDIYEDRIIYGGVAEETHVYMLSEESLDPKEVIEILANPDESKISVCPPQKPKGGEVYLITDDGNKNRKNNWSADGYLWVNRGRYSVPKKNPAFFVRRYSMSRHKNDNEGGIEFQRKVYWQENSHLKLVHYRGDESQYVPRPHGNDKSDNGIEYRRTLPSVIHDIRDKGIYKTPQNVYQSLTTKHSKGSHLGVNNPRNSEQVRNVQKRLRRDKRLTKDEIFSTVQLAFHVQGMIREITVYPDLSIILSHQDLLEELNKLLMVKSNEPLLMSYDTTFEVGDFFISAFVFKHVLFQGGVAIPAAFMVHDRIQGELHDNFWKKMAKMVPNLTKYDNIFVTDREKGIRNAIQNNLPNSKIFHCWNHIKRNIRFWLNKHGARADDHLVYKRDVEALLQCESEPEFFEVYGERSVTWSESFKDYFDTSLRDDILTFAARWLLEEAEVYDPYSGITNNVVESMNVVVKRLMEWKEVPIDSVVLSLNFLQNFYHNELVRGFCGVGNFKLKQRHKSAALERDDIEMPSEIYQPDQIVEIVKGHMTEEETEFDTQSDESDTEETAKRDEPTSQRGLAMATLKKKKILHVPEASAFIVEGSKGDKYTVQLFPTETCQCPSLGTCYHIMAAKMSIGQIELNEKKVANLTLLRKNNRKRPDKKAGKKRPRPCDEKEISVIPAPDSVLHTSFACSTPNVQNVAQAPSIMRKSKLKEAPASRKRFRFDRQLEAISEIPLPHVEEEEDICDAFIDSRETCLAKSFSDDADKNRTTKVAELENDVMNKAEGAQTTTSISKEKSIQKTDSEKSTSPVFKSTKTIPTKTRSNENRQDLKGRTHQRRAEASEQDLTCPLTPKRQHEKSKRVWLSLDETICLHFKEKYDILHDKKLCCNVINFAQALLKIQFPDLNGFQYTGYAPLLKGGKWEYSLQMSHQEPPSVQIHHTGHDHWVTSAQDENGVVYIFDSNNPRHTMSASTQIQVCKVYGKDDNELCIKMPNVQQQTNSVDCGVFAIAFMAEFCFNSFTGKENIVFDIETSRNHLLQCLAAKLIRPFPKKRSAIHKLKLNRSFSFKIATTCRAKCNFPDMYDDLVCCDGCSSWYHYGCTGTARQSFSDSKSFVCNRCSW